MGLEASCDALLILQLLGADANVDDAVRSRLQPAIESLRQTIAELRMITGEASGVLSLGFVIGPSCALDQPAG